MRAHLFAIALAAVAAPVWAETQDHPAHVAQADGLRVLHVWTPATAKGTDALIYLEIENTSATEVWLTGGEASGKALDLVGFRYGASGESWTVLPGLPVPAHGDLALKPNVLALRWSAIPTDLSEGAALKIEIAFGDRHFPADVEIGAAHATAHSHAGHGH